jgi:hypothetical protein
MVLVLSNMDLRLIGFAACILTCVVQTLLPLIGDYSSSILPIHPGARSADLF